MMNKIEKVKMSKEKIYDLMTGTLVLEALEKEDAELVTDEFGKGMPCAQLYHDMYEAKCRLCDRLEVTEDEDVELMIDNLLQIGKILSMKMYEYGALYGSDMEKK